MATTAQKKSQPSSSSSQQLRCSCCNKLPSHNATLLVCSGCRSVQYCNSDCQRKDWKTHKLTCKQKQKSSENEIAAAINAVQKKQEKHVLDTIQKLDGATNAMKSSDAVPESADRAQNEDPVNETGLSAADIEAIMELRSCTRRRAAVALRENGNDVVNAIMALTPGAKISTK